VKKPFAAGRVHGYSGYPGSVVNPAKINAFAKAGQRLTKPMPSLSLAMLQLRTQQPQKNF